MRNFYVCIWILAAVGGQLLSPSFAANVTGNWPTYRCDITRSGATSETIEPELFLQWKYIPKHPPKPAWPAPAEEMPRMHSDTAFHVAVADGNIYFGSSVTNKVHSINAASGKVRWTFFTEGPVRFAPSVADGRVYVGSDDGYVYCLAAKGGKLIWRYRAGPSGEKVIGNGRMISLWPVRTSVLVDDEVVYFGAGVFPYEGIYICALNAHTGSVIWKNDTVGDHAHELEYGGISPHGYLVASKDVLYVPSGRAMPAAFDRKTGKFLFYASPGAKRGGAWTLLDGDTIIAGVDATGDNSPDIPHKVAYDAKTGQRKGEAFGWFPAIDMVLTDENCYALTSAGIYAIDRVEYSEAVRKANQAAKRRKELGKKLSELRKALKAASEKDKEEIDRQIDRLVGRINKLAAQEKRLKDSSFQWHWPQQGLSTLILARDILFAGGENAVYGINRQTSKQVFKASIAGKAVGLAAASGRLFVSTDKGPIHCFSKERITNTKNIEAPCNPSPYSEDKTTKLGSREAGSLYQSAAENIVEQTSINKGYCLVLDCEIGRLALELAKRTELQIVGLETDPEKLAFARRNLEATAVLGARVVVEPWDISDLPYYFANLVVSDGMLLSGKTTAPMDQIERVLRPCGGVAYLGAKQAGKIRWKKSVRGKLAGAASWTHLYANPQNTACSGDKLLKGPFGLLWFGEPGPQKMVERHGRGVGPVSANGRLFIQGEELVMAYDAYNGTFLWERKIPGAARARADVDGGNLALTEDALYVATYDKCHRLDPATGQIVGTYELPAPGESVSGGNRRRWGYIACTDGILFGTAAMRLETEYGAMWKDFARTGRWKDLNKMPAPIRRAFETSGEMKHIYQYARSQYPKPDETARRAFQRAGANWHLVTDFPSWDSQRSPKNALNSKLMHSDAIFAIDANTSEVLWLYRSKEIPNISVTVADDTVFFVESTATDDQRQAAFEEKQRLIENGTYQPSAQAELKHTDADVRTIVALDAATGQLRWKKPLDLTGCGGNKMGTAYADGLLLLFGHFSNHDTRFFKKDELTWRRITALNAKTADVRWSRPLNYLRRPLIVGDKIIIEPRACDLHTGQIIKRKHPITGKNVPWEFLRPGHSCGITSASADTLFYRSYEVAIYELTEDKGLSLFGGIRPGCWLNIIAANGLMLMPESSSGCTCSFPLRCSFALAHKPTKVSSDWTVFITGGATTPVKHLAVNFGAPGDMKDTNGTLWFGYPRPKTVSNIGYDPYAVKFDLQERGIEGMATFCSDPRFSGDKPVPARADGVDIEQADRPWLFTSGYLGLLRSELPLIDDSAGQDPAIYTVRLGFKALPNDKPGQRVFDVKLQERVVLHDFDILQTAKTANKTVLKEFNNIQVTGVLKLELVPKSFDPNVPAAAAEKQAPIINFIEVIAGSPVPR